MTEVQCWQIRPGARCSEIAEELNSLLLELGMLELRTFGYGHSFGVISHYYGREVGPRPVFSYLI